MRLLLIEDSERLCETLTTGLGRLGFAVDVARDGIEGLSLATNNPYEIVVLDLMLPGLDGITLLRRLRERNVGMHVLVLTAKDRVQDRVIGLRAGADDYLVKPFDFDELVARLRALVRRRYDAKDPLIRLGGVSLDTTTAELRGRGQHVELGPREFALIQYLALRRGVVLSRTEIEDAIYDGRTLPNGNAVDSAICRLRAKLARFEGAPRIVTRRGHGYVLEEEAS
jgi:DNA-binding response OmpR family regulator